MTQPHDGTQRNGYALLRSPVKDAPVTGSPCMAEPPHVRFISRRFAIAGMMFWLTFSMYLVRVNISDSILDMAKEFHWTSTQKGLVLSSFFWGYITLQVRTDS